MKKYESRQYESTHNLLLPIYLVYYYYTTTYYYYYYYYYYATPPIVYSSYG